jgi:hypothetical protein
MILYACACPRTTCAACYMLAIRPAVDALSRVEAMIISIPTGVPRDTE